MKRTPTTRQWSVLTIYGGSVRKKHMNVVTLMVKKIREGKVVVDIRRDGVAKLQRNVNIYILIPKSKVNLL